VSDFVKQLPALIGVVIGAAGSYLAVAFGDRARFRRERTVRWEDRRLEAYAAWAAALKVTIGLLWRVAAHLGNDPHPHPLAPEDATVRLDAAAADRDLKWEAILLLATPDIVDAARAWIETVFAMEGFVRGGTHDPDSWHSLLASQRAARERFYAVARTDVSLPATAG
jgi:hypothetical protein